MPTSPLLPSHRTVSASLFKQLSELLHNTASIQDEEFCVITDRIAIAVEGMSASRQAALAQNRFTLVASKPFSALLYGQRKSTSNPTSTLATAAKKKKVDGTLNPTNRHHAAAGNDGEDRSKENAPSSLSAHSSEGDNNASDHEEPLPRYFIDLTFEPRAIAAFIRELVSDIPPDAPIQHDFRRALALLQTNSPGIQTEFTVELIHLLCQPSIIGENHTQEHQQAIHRSIETQLAQRTQNLHDAMLAAQAADQAKSEFLAAMSHELRTPLTYILGMSATLLRWSNHVAHEQEQEALQERQHQYLQNIHHQGEHLLELINDILDLSQLESGKMGLDLQEFSLSLLVQQTLKSYSDKARQKNIRLEMDMHIPAELDQFTADPRRIRQIILNLLSNAVKFTNPGGIITLRASASEDTVVLQVKDTGIGIPDHLQSDIFQKFRQLDSSYRREYEGTGLGLALTKQLVDLHGGRIECHSTLDVGTVFTVTLPRYPFTPLVHTSEPLDSRIRSHHPLGRVVLIENHDESAHFVSDMLMAAGYQLIWMLEGLTAVSQVEVLQPSVVIVGTNLIDSDSREIVTQLRRNPLTKHLKIVALGSERSLHEKSVYEEAGVDDFLVYPIHPEELLHRIGSAIASISIAPLRPS